MKVKFYLVISSGGSVRALKSKPKLAFDEISMLQNLELPDALFTKPALEATLIIPKEAAAPQQIQADVSANIKDAIEAASGLEVRLSVIQPEDL